MAEENKKEATTPWEDFLRDFTLILDLGERLRCHKWQMAKASPVLRAMIMSIMKEAKTGRCCIPNARKIRQIKIAHSVS